MCIDYRALNKNTIKNKFPILKIDDILHSLQGAEIFTRIDFRSGYQHIHIQPQDESKTTFRITVRLWVSSYAVWVDECHNRMMSRIFPQYRHVTGKFFDDILNLDETVLALLGLRFP